MLSDFLSCLFAIPAIATALCCSLHLRSTNDIDSVDGKGDNDDDDDKDAGPGRPKPKAKRRRKKDRRLVLRDCCNYGKGSIRLNDIVCRAECKVCFFMQNSTV